MTTAQEKHVAKELFGKVLAVLRADHAFDEDDVEFMQHVASGKVSRFAWSDMAIEVGRHVPGPTPEMALPFIAFDAFEGDCWDPLNDQVAGDVRIYCMPDPEQREVIEQALHGSLHEGCSFACLKFRTTEPSSTRRPLTETGFVQAIALEWANLLERLRSEEEEGDDDGVTCPACETITATSVDDDDKDDPDPKFCGNCGKELPAS